MLNIEINPALYRALESKAKQANTNVYTYIRELIKQDVL